MLLFFEFLHGHVWMGNLWGHMSSGVSRVMCQPFSHSMRSQGRAGGYVFDHMHEDALFLLWSKKLNSITHYFKDKIQLNWCVVPRRPPRFVPNVSFLFS